MGLKIFAVFCWLVVIAIWSLMIPPAFWDWLIRLKIYYFVHADERTKCPACGYRRKHRIAYSKWHNALLHECAFCKAIWAEQALVNPGVWAVPEMLNIPTEGDQQPTEYSPFSQSTATAPREPVVGIRKVIG